MSLWWCGGVLVSTFQALILQREPEVKEMEPGPTSSETVAQSEQHHKLISK
jgi:hypothetical protein